MGRIVAIDYGLKRVGVAWTDKTQKVPLPVGTFSRQELPQKIQHWIQNENIEKIVVGYPTRFSGAPTHLTPHVEAFVSELQNQYPTLEIHLQDERLSSVEAEKSYQTLGISLPKSKRKSMLDVASAVMILQRYLAKV
ncbi:MAG: Holliday junction resolvase RuvX [Bacteroidia bacterium]